MSCAKCAIAPDSHSFSYFGTSRQVAALGELKYYYTAPARARDYKETAETFNYYKVHIDGAKNTEWVWVVDCAGMKLHHYASLNLIRKLVKYTKAEHADQLKKVLVIHPNTWMKGTLQTLKTLFPNGLSKLTILEGEKTELMVGLEKVGIGGQQLQWLIRAFATNPEPGTLPPAPA